ncbi:MAG: prepilin-type N-terminal cleavage/methylation domain-containing protein [Rickettsiales bacterium]|nr:prepilin-type N-terminal cleavage/methylation domain-containing protein [Rickettsiales bacterium]
MLNKKSNNKINAFSLIELSIVILVVGILIAGVFQGNEMVRKARLQTAQNLTTSSPVTGIKDLVLWLETSLDQSFTSDQINDGANAYRWISNNVRPAPRYYAIRTASSAVTYKESSPINSLPAIYFNGSGKLTLSTTTSTANYTFIRHTMNCNATWFIVSKPNSISSNGSLFTNGASSNGGYGYNINSSTRTAVMYTVNTTSSATNLTLEPEIASYTYTNTSNTIDWSPLRLYANGYNLLPSGQLPCRAPVENYFEIGSGFSGYIAEMIFYDRSLKNEERQAVENYLSQKYSIKLNR